MSKLTACVLVCLIVWAAASKAGARRLPATGVPSVRFLAEHVQGVLRSKCRATYTSLRGSRVLWLRRHRLAHRVPRGRCRPTVDHISAWLCIHSHEGAWNDSGDPYWGGLQMDRTFMQTYAPRYLLRRGWANAWTPIEQMQVAERAYDSGRGFGPWPNTARMCGL